MKRSFVCILVLALTIAFCGLARADMDYKAKYYQKVKQNDETIKIIGQVINFICPRIVPPETKICDPKDPVGSAVKVQQYMEQYWNREEEDIEDAKMPKLLHRDAALQFWDAVEQFKKHIPYREKAKKAAEKGDWQNALLNEEMAWQYLVKCASRGIFAKKMVSGE